VSNTRWVVWQDLWRRRYVICCDFVLWFSTVVTPRN